jgi:hypothetical protein
MDESIGVTGSASVGNNEMGASVGGSVSIELGADSHAQVDSYGLSAGAEYHEVAQASATVSGSVEKEGVGYSGSATVYAKTGAEVEGHVDAGVHGIDIGAEASIGNAAGVEGEVTESLRYGSGTVGGGVSIGEHFEAGGGAVATFQKGVATVGVSGDLAAVVGLDVDVAVSINTNQIVADGKEVARVAEEGSKVVAKEAEKDAKVVAVVAEQGTKEVAKVATTATNTITSTAKSVTKTVTNSVSKAFKKLKF